MEVPILFELIITLVFDAPFDVLYLLTVNAARVTSSRA